MGWTVPWSTCMSRETAMSMPSRMTASASPRAMSSGTSSRPALPAGSLLSEMMTHSDPSRPALMHHDAAVDVERRSGDVRGPVGSDERDHLSHVAGSLVLLLGNEVAEVLLGLVQRHA